MAVRHLTSFRSYNLLVEINLQLLVFPSVGGETSQPSVSLILRASSDTGHFVCDGKHRLNMKMRLDLHYGRDRVLQFLRAIIFVQIKVKRTVAEVLGVRTFKGIGKIRLDPGPF